jgi:UTP--glucose-1-phosphate uridylyltransferase
VQEREGGSVIALMEVDPAQIHLYGCAAVKPTAEGDVVKITDLVEKPDPADAPSNLAIIGRYVLDPAVFAILRETEPGRGGEIQLTDALQKLAEAEQAAAGSSGGPVHGVVFKGRRYDTGDRGDYLRAIVRLACEREDLGPEFRDWLRSFVTEEM